MEKQWYVVHTYAGYENKVKANLEKRVESMGMQDKIFRVIVPEEEEKEIRNGKEKIIKRKVFPGYVLAELIMTDDSWYVVRNTPGVTGFVGSAGSGSKPTPLLPEEVEVILNLMGLNKEEADIEYEIGETVRINNGVFNDYVGEIIEMDVENKQLRVVIKETGQEMVMELAFTEVEKL